MTGSRRDRRELGQPQRATSSSPARLRGLSSAWSMSRARVAGCAEPGGRDRHRGVDTGRADATERPAAAGRAGASPACMSDDLPLPGRARQHQQRVLAPAAPDRRRSRPRGRRTCPGPPRRTTPAPARGSPRWRRGPRARGQGRVLHRIARSSTTSSEPGSSPSCWPSIRRAVGSTPARRPAGRRGTAPAPGLHRAPATAPRPPGPAPPPPRSRCRPAASIAPRAAPPARPGAARSAGPPPAAPAAHSSSSASGRPCHSPRACSKSGDGPLGGIRAGRTAAPRHQVLELVDVDVDRLGRSR